MAARSNPEILAAVTELKSGQTKLVSDKALIEAAKFIVWLESLGIARDVATPAVGRFVEAVAGKKQQAKVEGPTAARGPAFTALTRRYAELYQGLYKEAPMLTGADYGHLGRLLQQYSAPVIEQRIMALEKFVKSDSFMAKLGFSLAVLVNQWNRVAAYARQNTVARPDAPSDCRHSPPCVDAVQHTRTMLAEHRR